MNKSLFMLVTAFYFSQYIQAQTDSATKSLDEVIVTANRFPQKQNTTGKVVTIIPRSVIEKSSGFGLGELLNQQAGLTLIGANNTLGTNQDVYMRGAATGNTLILVDGIPVNDASTIANTFDINHLPLDNIERIEILKGAQSTLYGSDAVAGVIHNITRKQSTKPVTVSGTLAGGSYDTYKASVGLQGKIARTQYQLQYQHLQSGGFSAAFDSSGKGNFDKDGYKQNVFSGSFQTPVSKKLLWKGNGQWGRYKNDLDAAAYQDEKDFTADNTNMQLGTGIQYKSEKLNLQANYNYNRSARSYLDDSAFVSGFNKYSAQEYTGRSHFAELYGTYKLSNRAEFLAGMDYRWSNTDQQFLSVSSFGPYETNLSSDSAKINLYSFYGYVFLNNGKGFFLEAGGRLNQHSRFGSNATFTLNPSFVLKDQWKFFANLSSAFKAPSLYQLYDANVGSISLNPERSITGEAGLQYFSTSKKWNSRLVFFARDIKDGIDFSFVDFRYFNNNRQKDKGLEFEFAYNIKKWQFTQNYTYVTGEVNTTKYTYDPSGFSYIPNGDTTYNNLFRRPKHSMNLGISFQATERLFLRVNGRFLGKRFEPRFMESPIELDAYETVDIYGEYRFFKKSILFLELKNIFNEGYFDVAGFNTRRRNFMAGIRIGF
jgi:vitamin B12 transporter